MKASFFSSLQWRAGWNGDWSLSSHTWQRNWETHSRQESGSSQMGHCLQGVHQPGNLGILRLLSESGKVRWMSGNFHRNRHQSGKSSLPLSQGQGKASVVSYTCGWPSLQTSKNFLWEFSLKPQEIVSPWSFCSTSSAPSEFPGLIKYIENGKQKLMNKATTLKRIRGMLLNDYRIALFDILHVIFCEVFRSFATVKFMYFPKEWPHYRTV